MALDALAKGRLYLAALESRGEILAAFIAFLDPQRGQMRAWLTTYDLAFAELSPSRLLIERATKWCFDNGYTLLDWASDAEYKRRWATKSILYGVYLLGLSGRGRERIAEQLAGDVSASSQMRPGEMRTANVATGWQRG